MVRPLRRPPVNAIVAEPVVRQLGRTDEVDALKVERLSAAVAANKLPAAAAGRAVVVILDLRGVSVGSGTMIVTKPRYMQDRNVSSWAKAQTKLTAHGRT